LAALGVGKRKAMVRRICGVVITENHFECIIKTSADDSGIKTSKTFKQR